ncbi:MAG: branched-chain amino acid dehydrogenase, partial [Peptostreptococcaceae bacterium]|nr:branched-chain amino acid dehydrogenase [Peptostreptococcaceae bacterium]MBK5254318.1 branched-chain amino acid dehydrogenase [Peptostreptococcaceae bacterium]
MTMKMKTAQEAIAGLEDGMTIMVAGFLGTGSPEILMDAILEKGVK